jgi:Flp pilus assembly protein TadD
MTPAGNKWGPVWIKSGTTSSLIVMVVIGLAVADRFLAKVESAEIRNTAQQSYSAGSRLLEQGKTEAAIDYLRDAHALERQNTDYEMQLIAALTAAGKAPEAEPLVTDVLQRAPNDGRANLMAARLTIRKGNTGEAEAYYHRAIYGTWSGSPVEHRAAIRMELVELLLKKDQKQALLAELISLDAEPPPSRDIQRRLGELFILAGAPGRAAGVYQSLVEKDPKDVAAYEGLGEAELRRGQYRAAHSAFFQASLRDPGDGSVRAHLKTLNMVTELDPTLRPLTSAEKYRRSVRILEMARAQLGRCDASSVENTRLLNAADATIAGKEPAHVTNEAAEGVLSLAEQLWHAGVTTCGASTGSEDALGLIMTKLGS